MCAWIQNPLSAMTSNLQHTVLQEQSLASSDRAHSTVRLVQKAKKPPLGVHFTFKSSEVSWGCQNVLWQVSAWSQVPFSPLKNRYSRIRQLYKFLKLATIRKYWLLTHQQQQLQQNNNFNKTTTMATTITTTSIAIIRMNKYRKCCFYCFDTKNNISANHQLNFIWSTAQSVLVVFEQSVVKKQNRISKISKNNLTVCR